MKECDCIVEGIIHMTLQNGTKLFKILNNTKYLQYQTWYSHLHKIQLWYALLSKHSHNTDNAYFLMLLIFCPTGTIFHSTHVDKMFNGKIEINDIQKQGEQQQLRSLLKS